MQESARLQEPRLHAIALLKMPILGLPKQA
jgi:hypothetical protein